MKKTKHKRNKANFQTNPSNAVSKAVSPLNTRPISKYKAPGTRKAKIKPSIAKTPFSRKSMSIHNSYMKTVDLRPRYKKNKPANKQETLKADLISIAKKESEKLKTKVKKNRRLIESQGSSTIKLEKNKMNMTTDMSLRPPTYKKPTTGRMQNTMIRSIYDNAMKSPPLYSFRK